jgi:hypothetical protein
MAIGKRGNLPFLPGGFENEIDSVLKQSESICGDDEQKFLDFTGLFIDLENSRKFINNYFNF